LHFNNPNPNIDFACGRLAVPVKLMPLIESNNTIMASVNSYGYGCTNSHIILEHNRSPVNEVESSDGVQTETESPYLLPLSAKTEKALIETCQSLQEFLQSDTGQAISLADLNYSLAYRRSALVERLTIAAKDKNEFEQKLTAV